jgi:hypothetical protein
MQAPACISSGSREVEAAAIQLFAGAGQAVHV